METVKAVHRTNVKKGIWPRGSRVGYNDTLHSTAGRTKEKAKKASS